jgi:hypothetical protein
MPETAAMVWDLFSLA